jgi:hypothetical protein
MTAATGVSALTFQRTSHEKPTVLQARWAYEQTAHFRYEWAKGSERMPKAESSRIVLQEYVGLPEDEAMTKITDRIARNSFDHERQHVEDGYFADDSASQMTPEEMTGADTFNEMRGLLRAVASEDPKMGMLGVYMWRYSSNESNAEIGATVERLFARASGKSLDDVLHMDDAELTRIATAVLRATDPWYTAARTARFNVSDARLQYAEQQFIGALEGMRTQQ